MYMYSSMLVISFYGTPAGPADFLAPALARCCYKSKSSSPSNASLRSNSSAAAAAAALASPPLLLLSWVSVGVVAVGSISSSAAPVPEGRGSVSWDSPASPDCFSPEAAGGSSSNFSREVSSNKVPSMWSSVSESIPCFLQTTNRKVVNIGVQRRVGAKTGGSTYKF